MSEIGKRLGQRIRELRTQRAERWTQEDLAERARISVSFLSMIERAQRMPRVKILTLLANALGITLSQLFAGVGESQTGIPVNVANAIFSVPSNGTSKQETSK